MARASGRRAGLLGLIAAGLLVCLVGHWAASLASAFVQPRAQREAAGPEVAALGAVAGLTASLPAEAFTGPLTGSEVCKSKPLVWFIYPLCDPVFLAAPTYFFPLIFIFYAVIVTTIQLLIPATQPDEDLR
eukprot:CAMPEP_0204516448 /NCGR_PEP_ID=MMETSP0661-20131031/3147_1 /ASSEMBLY_ACC=CAM_ASM_000606 /TAXON_ID=109239 /ORGANISM="Alexandrium margalefi, Strain AMGDE01CS-322" /LENGTH=130 /DNA_ID=CAMNT_0051521801 /DNA_START=87 /DNA_END=479 /DNA_ORIENTATION=-